MGGDGLAVKFRKQAPMEGRTQVVRGVKAVIQKEPVDEPTGDVARVVERGIVIAILML
jgi:hypothetical protein